MHGNPFRRWLIGLGCAGALVAAGAAPARAATASFTAPGCTTWVVPDGVSTVKITATGSAGQAGTPGYDGVEGGTGDVVSGSLTGLGGGETLDVCVDVGGGPGGTAFVYDAGDGGGASGVALGADFGDPVLVAAGGGGGGASSNELVHGGDAGYPSGEAGGTVTGYDAGGKGGTQSAGGAGGIGACAFCFSGTAGSRFSSAGPGVGGTGGSDGVSGGGGGGGYYGGGGGAGSGGFTYTGGGGGGSDFCAEGLADCGVIGENATFGVASVVLTYAQGHPAASVSPASLTFPTTPVGERSAERTVTLSNDGTVPLTGISPSTTPGFAITGSTCGGTLGVDADCTIAVVSAPVSSGPQSGTLTIAGDAPDGPQTVTLSGDACDGTCFAGGEDAGPARRRTTFTTAVEHDASALRVGRTLRAIRVTIDWGDGTATTGTAVITAAGVISLQGDHYYRRPGTYHVTTTVIDGRSTANHNQGDTQPQIVHSQITVA